MKKLTLLLLAALLLLSVLAACSATANMEGSYPRGYSNVSTTHNGTVNGTNSPASGAYDSWYDARRYSTDITDTARQQTDSARATRKAGTTQKNSATHTVTGTTRAGSSAASGTGMAGGR